MKKFFTLVLAIGLVWPAAAQHFDFNAIKSHLLQLKGAKTLSETAGSGHDKDSVESRQIETKLSLPYKSKSDKQTVDAAIEHIKAAYADRQASATKAVAHIQALEETELEGPAIKIGYVKTPSPIAIGGKGHSYVLVRQTGADKPQVSTYDGAQWWLDKAGKRVVFHLLHISGRHQASGTQTRMVTWDQGLDSLRGLSQEELFERLGIKPEDIEKAKRGYLDPLNLKGTLKDLSLLKSLRSKMGSAYASSIVKLSNERVQQALNYIADNNQTYKVALFLSLANQGNYKAEIISGKKSEKIEAVGLMELARRWPSLKVFCVSFEGADTPVAKKYKDCDGVIQVFLDE
ncbi:MAG: hypothetical protein ACI4V2_06850 [Alloprevotella sp.]